MSSPTSFDFLPRRLESIGISPPKKRTKIANPALTANPKQRPSLHLHNLQPELLGMILTLLAPDIANPVHEDCGLVDLSRVSKMYRSMALGGHGWKAICVARWTDKVGFKDRLAKAEKEAAEEVDTNEGILGSYWYRKFGIEERNASRNRITRSELNDKIFSIRLWFFAKSYPPSVKREKGVAPSGLHGASISDNMRFLPGGRQVSGLPERFSTMYYEMNDEGTVVNFGTPLKNGTNHLLLSLQVHRRSDWGWELRSNLYCIRSISGATNVEEVWKEYTSCLVVEKRKDGTKVNRRKVEYNYRQIPNVDNLKEYLVW